MLSHANFQPADSIAARLLKSSRTCIVELRAGATVVDIAVVDKVVDKAVRAAAGEVVVEAAGVGGGVGDGVGDGVVVAVGVGCGVGAGVGCGVVAGVAGSTEHDWQAAASTPRGKSEYSATCHSAWHGITILLQDSAPSGFVEFGYWMFKLLASKVLFLQWLNRNSTSSGLDSVWFMLITPR